MLAEFWEARRPLFDPDGFLHLTIGRAHDAVVDLGRGLPQEIRPRATCAACIVQGSSAYWAHVGDSRAYLVRGEQMEQLTEDHSLVNELLKSGKLSADEAHLHPQRSVIKEQVEMGVAVRMAVIYQLAGGGSE